MQFNRLSTLVLSCALLILGTACVVRSDGGLVFSQGKEAAERNETLPLELSSGEALRVDLVYGDIAVRAVEGEAPHVDAHWHANAADKATAEAVLARYRLEFSREGGALRVHVVGEPLEVKSGFVTNRLAAGVSLSLVVPTKVSLKAHSDSGDLAASGQLGSCELSSSYGDVSVSGARGEVSLSTSSGNATVEDIEANKVELASQYGDVRAKDVRAESVRLKTSSGNVVARDVQGELALSSEYGSLKIEGSNGALDARTSSGNIEASVDGEARRRLMTSYGNVRVRGGNGDLEAKSSSGDVSIEGAGGTVNAVSSYGDVSVRGCWTRLEAVTSSGEVEVEATAGSAASSPWRIHSSYGDVSLKLPSDFSCELSASATSGTLRSDFATKDERKLHKWERTIGAGGNTVEVHSSSGDVKITTAPGSVRKI